MKKWKSYQVAIIVIACLLVNFFGKALAEKLALPLWLDSAGTVFAAYIFGPFCGAVVGVGINLMYGAFITSAYIYCITNLVVGIVAGYCARKGMFKKPFSVFSVAMILALSSTIISLPLNYLYYGGLTGNMWGDGVIGYLNEKGAIKSISYFVGEFYVDILDKLISCFLVYYVVSIYKKIKNKRQMKKSKTTKNIAMIMTVVIALFIPAKYIHAEEIKMETPNKNNSYYDSYIQMVYNNTNGIPGGEVNAIEQTLDGMLWIGTYGGLYQYDGNKFIFMDDFDSVRNVNCLYTDEEGRLWIGTNDSGISISANIEVVNVIDKTGGLPEDSVRCISKGSDGLYYVGTTGAMCTVALADGVRVTKVLEELKYVTNIASIDGGYVCVTTLNGELALLRDSEIKIIYKNNVNGDAYETVYYGTDGYVYAATSGNIIEKYIVKDDKLELVDTYECGTLVKINSMYLVEDLLFVCADNGVGHIGKNGEFSLINTNNFDSSIDNILVDYQGNLWLSSSRLGLLKLSESISEEIYTRVGLDKKVINAITQWNNRYYFGTDSGIDIVNDTYDSVVKSNITELFDKVRIRCLMVDSNNHLWVATSGNGVYEIASEDEYVNYSVSNGLAGDKTRSILELSDGTILVATDTGISYIKAGKVVACIDSTDGLVNAKTLCLYESDDMIYAGSDGGGLTVISDGKVKKVYRKSNGLSSDVILRIKEASDGSGLLLVTSNGLNFLQKNGVIRQLNNFPYYNNFDILFGENGNLWVTSSAGIYIVDEDDLLANKELEYELLDSKNGLRESLIANSWNYTDKNSNLLLCGGSGVISINMKKYNKHRISYRIMLDNIMVDGKIVNIDKEEINIISRDSAKIEFFPKVINFSASNPYVSVWLEGFDKEPKVVLQSELETMVYTNLLSGNYTFHLGILDSKKQHITEQVSYRFEKEKEIYDNWWFVLYILLILAIIVVYLVWLIVGSQIDKNLKIQKKEFENLKLKQTAEAAVAAGEAKDRFLALMSHDIRTPINAILGMNEMILRESNEKKIFEYSQDIKSAGNTLLSLVNMILDYSKIEEGKMEVVPINYETRNLLSNLINGVSGRAKEKNLTFNISIDEKIPCELYGDDLRVSQIISNLLTNAVKYTETGFVNFTVKEQDRNEDRVFLYVEVKDSGIGIRNEDMDKLFESFRRLDEKKNRNIEGTGLGMSIVSNLLYLMNSELKVESEYGKGSTFSFVIEQKIVNNEAIGNFDVAKGNHTTQKAEKHIWAEDAKILVVDDNEMNIKVARNLLKINGIKPDTAMSGEEALKWVENNQYHIIFLDHMMPDMDGIETFETMRSRNLIGDAKVIILTANAITGAREQYLKIGFDDYLSKPIEIEALETKLKKYLPKELYETNNLVENQKKESTTATENSNDNNTGNNSRLNVETGLKYCMDSMEFYRDILQEYISGNKTEQLNELFDKKDWHNYRILIHSVKSNSMSIGAENTSELAKALEYAARDNDIEYIEKEHSDFIYDYNNLLEEIKDYLNS